MCFDIFTPHALYICTPYKCIKNTQRTHRKHTLSVSLSSLFSPSSSSFSLKSLSFFAAGLRLLFPPIGAAFIPAHGIHTHNDIWTSYVWHHFFILLTLLIRMWYESSLWPAIVYAWCKSSVLGCFCPRTRTTHTMRCVRHTASHCTRITHTMRCVQHMATHCDTLCTHNTHKAMCATHCNTLRHIASHCNTLHTHHTHKAMCATHCNTLRHIASHCNTLHTHHTHNAMCATHRNTLQHTATHCTCITHTMQCVQHIATHCNTLQHTATPYNTLQHTAHASHTQCDVYFICMARLFGTNNTTLSCVRYESSTWGCICTHVQHTHCNTLQHTATHCNTLQHTATQCICTRI